MEDGQGIDLTEEQAEDDPFDDFVESVQKADLPPVNTPDDDGPLAVDDPDEEDPATSRPTELIASDETETTLQNSDDPTDGPPQIALNTDDDGTISAIEPQADEGSLVAGLADTIGTSSPARARELLYRLLDLTSFIHAPSRRQLVLNRVLAMLHDRDIQSGVEATQYVQMLIADQIQTEMVRKSMLAEDTELKGFYLKWCERFMEQTTGKAESLQELKDEPEQRVRVEHVELQEGSQAVLGNFSAEDEGGG